MRGAQLTYLSDKCHLVLSRAITKLARDGRKSVVIGPAPASAYPHDDPFVRGWTRARLQIGQGGRSTLTVSVMTNPQIGQAEPPRLTVRVPLEPRLGVARISQLLFFEG